MLHVWGSTYSEDSKALVDLLRILGQTVLGEGDDIALTAHMNNNNNNNDNSNNNNNNNNNQ